jgi:hypothetical protein
LLGVDEQMLRDDAADRLAVVAGLARRDVGRVSSKLDLKFRWVGWLRARSLPLVLAASGCQAQLMTANPSDDPGEPTCRRRADLDPTDLPAGPAAYAWCFDGAPFHIGDTDDLRTQVFERDLIGGLSRVPTARRGAQRVLRRRGRWPTGAPKPDRIAAINALLDESSIGWVATETRDQARSVADDYNQQTHADARWHPRPGEDRILQRYLDSLNPSPAGPPSHTRCCWATRGTVLQEVPIGGRFIIDAVRFPLLADQVIDFDHEVLIEGVASGVIELIEVKQRLNRTVFGQLVLGRELAVDEWQPTADSHLEAVALVEATDANLAPYFMRHGVRVVVA